MRRRLVFCAFLVFLLLSAGCGRGSFVGKRLDNFSAYYNTYYNAENALEEGIKALDTGQEQQPIDQDFYLSLFSGSEQATSQRKPFEDAIIKCADILRKHPDSKWVDDAVLVIGKAWFYTQNYVGAEEKFNEILTLESRLHDEARFWLARTLIASGQYLAAFDHLQVSLNRDDLSRRWEPKLRLALAELHVRRKSWDEAAAELEALAEDWPDHYEPLYRLGNLLRGQERFAEAAEAYDRAFERLGETHQRHWTLYYLRGIALERSDQWDRAEVDFLRALELEPEQPYVMNYLAYSWVEQKRNLDEAKKMLARAVELRPTDGFIVDSLGWVYYRLSDYEKAVTHLEKAVELRPQDPVINDHLGDAYWKVGRYQEARFQWRRALSLEPEADLIPVIEAKIEKGLQAESERI